jgi:hypothetical protein
MFVFVTIGTTRIGNIVFHGTYYSRVLSGRYIIMKWFIKLVRILPGKLFKH